MTKYVLNSGNISSYPDKQRAFFAEFTKGLGQNPKVLIVLFSRPREYWEQTFYKYESQLSSSAPEGVNATFELAMPNTFEQQIKNSDILYIAGGDDYLLRFWLDKYDLPKIWDGKVIATSSAGSDVLVSHFWTCDWRMNMDGLGILPIKFLPHYNSDYGSDDPYRDPIDWSKALAELKEYGDKELPVYSPEEGDFIVIEQ
jgi:hypothetical protein